MIEKISRLLKSVNNLITSEEFIEKHRINQKCFNRNRKFNFKDIILFLLSQPQKSLSVALSDYIDSSNLAIDSISKQAFSKARFKIKPDAFREIFLMTTDVNKTRSNYNTWNGHPVLAIDGTSLQIPNTKENQTYFGSKKNQYDPVALASASALYDVLNDNLLNTKLVHYRTSELVQAETLIDEFNLNQVHGEKAPIIIFDRGYPSRKLYAQLQEKQCFFVMRHKTKSHGALKAVYQCNYGDTSIQYSHNDCSYPLRVIKFDLPSGLQETLVTNLFDPTITVEMFKELYFIRWGIETKYREVKSILKLENFMGIKPEAIEQEFYAAMFASNLLSMFTSVCNEEISNIQQETKKTTCYKTNRNILVNYLFNKLYTLICNYRIAKKVINNLIKIGIKNRSQVRTNRSYERKKMRSRMKFSQNTKSTL